MLLKQTVHTKCHNQYINYEDLGYIPDKNGYVDVNVKHLPINSQKMVKCKCDYCGDIIDVMYSNYIKSINKAVKKTACKKCISKKRDECNMVNYGHKNPSQFPGYTEAVQKTNMEKYGTLYYVQTEEYKNRYKETVMEKYGCENVSQAKEIRQKITDSFYNNNSQKSSRQQRHICNLYEGILNYPIGFYNADILLNNNIVVEYDGGGHDLKVKLNQITKEEQYQNDLKRYYYLKKKGYKQIKIISSNDKIPNDDILIKMKNMALTILNQPHCYWVEYNIDKNTIRSSINHEGLCFDFGQLKRIYKED